MGDVHLAPLGCRCVKHPESGRIIKVDRLGGDRKCPGNEGLRRNDRRHRGQCRHGPLRPTRGEEKERVFNGFRRAKQERSLPEVVEDERRENDEEPTRLDRPTAKVAEIGIERLTTGDDEEHRPEDEKATKSIMYEKAHRVCR